MLLVLTNECRDGGQEIFQCIALHLHDFKMFEKQSQSDPLIFAEVALDTHF